jgi:hypothetical protein
MVALELLKLAEETVVLGVRDLGAVEHVVLIRGPLDLLAQRGRAGRELMELAGGAGVTARQSAPPVRRPPC